MKLERIDQYKIHSYDSDLKGKLSLPVLTRFLQETAWLHSDDMKIGYKELLEQNMAWVLYKQYIQMDEWPSWGNIITIRTWPSQSDKLFCYREFEIFNNDSLIGKVSSSWLVINLKTRRPVRTSSYYNGNYQGNKKILFPEIIKTKMHSPESQTITKKHSVVLLDLDVNNHVNNSLYPQWCLNSYNPKFYRNHTLMKIEQQFFSEAKFGDELSINTTKIDPLIFKHQIMRDNKELFLLQLNWIKTNNC